MLHSKGGIPGDLVQALGRVRDTIDGELLFCINAPEHDGQMPTIKSIQYSYNLKLDLIYQFASKND